MAEQLYGLTKDDVTVLRQLVAAYRSGQLGRPIQPGHRMLPVPQQAYVGRCGVSGITAKVSTLAGNGTVTLCTVSSSGLIEPTTETVTAYNLSDGDVAASAHVHVKREALTGRWVVDFENCDD